MTAANDSLGPHEYTIGYGPRNITLYGGWMSSPNRRGTIDIIWACIFTVFLCSWSILCLNLPAYDDGFWKRARRKFQWTWMTIMGPEVLFQLSLGEWLVARRAYKLYHKSGHTDWTMSHSFYANMGGVILRTPDYDPFPINAIQLHYLIEEKHIAFPTIGKRVLQDKNKAEPIVRALTLCQTLWFLVQCIARAIQGLVITTLELSTLAFISSAVGTFFCWYHKPMDVETAVTINLEGISIAQIRAKAGIDDDFWVQTPLEFIDRRPEWPWNVSWRWGLALMSKKMGLDVLVLRERKRPIERIPDDYSPEPTLKSLPFLFFFHLAYVAVLMAGWNLDLPSYTELVLWRIASCIQLGTIISAWFTMPMQLQNSPEKLQKIFSFVAKKRRRLLTRHFTRDLESDNKRHWYGRSELVPKMKKNLKENMDGARRLISDDPEWIVSLRMLAVYETTWLVYLVARGYVVVEDVVSLRAMPPSAFDTPNWSAFLPHF